MPTVKIACLVLVLGITGFESAEAQGKVTRLRNGVRLVDGKRPARGRVEVSTKNWALSGSDENTWVPVCEEDFTDDHAKIMCIMLGFKDGRKYYKENFNYVENATVMPAGRINCYPSSRNSRRDLLSTVRDTTSQDYQNLQQQRLRGDLSHDGGLQQQQQQQLGRRSMLTNQRRLLFPLMGQLDAPASAPYTCSYMLGDCLAKGPLAGIECFRQSPMPPARSPPPRPPKPPPAPPLASSYIRIFGGFHMGAVGDVEPNLCPSSDVAMCKRYSRIELKVSAPVGGGGSLWAPLCASKDSRLQWTVAYIACQQSYDWPERGRRGFVYPEVSEEAFTIPTGTVFGPGMFNPAAVAAWVTVINATVTADANRVQDLELKVSSEPCTDGLMAVYCQSAWV